VSKGIRIARIYGIDIYLHSSWFVILAVMVWSLGGSLSRAYPEWSPATSWIVAVAAAMLLFVSVLAHELAHSFVARRQGIAVTGITLYLLGGLANIAEEARSPGREALMAGAGPASSLAIGVVFYAAGHITGLSDPVRATLLYLGWINIALAVFNLLPGFPLDGGRVLRATIWAITGDPVKGLRGAARAGQVIGWGLVLVGVAWVAGLGTSGVVGALWWAFIGWTLIQASNSALARTAAQRHLAGLTVSAFVVRPVSWVPPEMPLHEAAQYLQTPDARWVPVAEDGRTLRGLLCRADLEHVAPASWATASAGELMRPLSSLPTVPAETPAARAFEQVVGGGAELLAVTDGTRLLGFVDRDSIARFFATARPPAASHQPPPNASPPQPPNASPPQPPGA
jgi:Zn-dependent protease/CBS domain-containing protein